MHLGRVWLVVTLAAVIVPVTFLGSPAPLAAQEDAKPLPGIYIMDVDGGNLRQAVKLAGKWTGTPSISPDGKTLLFDASPEGRYQLGHLYVMPVDGNASDARDLGVGSAPCWSPDGKQIVFYVHNGNPDGADAGIWTMKADGTGRRWATLGRGPRWSPDGRRLLVVDNLEGNGDGLYILDLADRAQMEVVLDQPQRLIAGASWSPDGKRLAYVRDTQQASQLVIQSLEGDAPGERIRLSRSLADARGSRSGRAIGWRPTWSPDGKYVLVWIVGAAGTEQLHRVEVDATNDPELLSHQDAGHVNTDPNWSPDGKRIVFASDR